MEDMELAVQAGASQIILGTIFETDCKKGLQGKGVEFVRQICARCPVPVYAIGGMNLERISLCLLYTSCVACGYAELLYGCHRGCACEEIPETSGHSAAKAPGSSWLCSDPRGRTAGDPKRNQTLRR